MVDQILDSCKYIISLTYAYIYTYIAHGGVHEHTYNEYILTMCIGSAFHMWKPFVSWLTQL